jgi:hypothetical protein
MSEPRQTIISGSELGQGGTPVPSGGSSVGEICIANISVPERRKRLAAGGIQLAISLAILTVLITTGASRWWRLPLLLLFWGAAVGFYQWRDKT